MGNLFDKLALARSDGAEKRGLVRDPEEVVAGLIPILVRQADAQAVFYEYEVDKDIARAVADGLRAQGLRVALEIIPDKEKGQRAKLHISLTRPHVPTVTPVPELATPNAPEENADGG